MTEAKRTDYPLTKYSHGAGCGCKIAPAVLDQILGPKTVSTVFDKLLVGNTERDDAAVFDLGDGTAAISTTDFFMPIVDDAQTFGRIAAVNAISDIYAMGGTPLMAIAILGWPVDKIPPAVAKQVVEGGRQACAQAGIPLAGGHSIDSPEPIFGLAVTGRVPLDHLKRNGGAQPGDLLYLTKPLGVGIFSTAQKRECLAAADAELAIRSMTHLNQVGTFLGTRSEVRAMTDVTGFGLMGHLVEMCTASDTSARIHFDRVPLLAAQRLDYYLDQGCIPGGTKRNFASYGHLLQPMTERQRLLLCDPQTSGGLLIAVAPEAQSRLEAELFAAVGQSLQPIGQMIQTEEYRVQVQ